MAINHSIINNFSKKTLVFTSTVLKGFGQIMLQENHLTGMLFLIGIFYGSVLMGLAALLATICGTATAYILKYDSTEVSQGLYGFSAALVGVAVMLFLKPVFVSWILLIILSSLATVLQHLFIKRKIAAFTLPFVLVTWTLLIIARIDFLDLLLVKSTAIKATINDFDFIFKGYGQVIFQDNLIAGILFFVGVLISSPISALYGLVGGIVSAFIALKLSVPINDINLGLFSYNAVLCAIVFAGTKKKNAVWALIAVLLALFLHLLMIQFAIVPLTFPFVLASYITLILISKPLFLRKKRIPQ